MIKYDANHPNGIELPPDKPVNIEWSPVISRQMTEEERERYAKLKPPKKFVPSGFKKELGEV